MQRESAHESVARVQPRGELGRSPRSLLVAGILALTALLGCADQTPSQSEEASVDESPAQESALVASACGANEGPLRAAHNATASAVWRAAEDFEAWPTSPEAIEMFGNLSTSQRQHVRYALYYMAFHLSSDGQGFDVRYRCEAEAGLWCPASVARVPNGSSTEIYVCSSISWQGPGISSVTRSGISTAGKSSSKRA